MLSELKGNYLKDLLLAILYQNSYSLIARGYWIGGIGLCVLEVVLALFRVVVLLCFFKFVATRYVLPLGISMLVVTLFMFAFGWYSFKSAKPQGTLNVHNQ